MSQVVQAELLCQVRDQLSGRELRNLHAQKAGSKQVPSVTVRARRRGQRTLLTLQVRDRTIEAYLTASSDNLMMGSWPIDPNAGTEQFSEIVKEVFSQANFY